MRLKCILQIFVIFGMEGKVGNGFLNGNIYENNKFQVFLFECIFMNGVCNLGFGDDLLVSFNNDDVFFDLIVKVIIKVELFLGFVLRNLCLEDQIFGWLN